MSCRKGVPFIYKLITDLDICFSLNPPNSDKQGSKAKKKKKKERKKKISMVDEDFFIKFFSSPLSLAAEQINFIPSHSKVSEKL